MAVTRSTPFARRIIGALAIGLLAACSDGGRGESSRCDAVHKVLADNLKRGAHFQKSVNLDTLRAARRAVTAADTACLIALLDDEREAIAIAAGYLLVSFGENGVQQLRTVAEATKRPSRLRAKEMLLNLEASPDLLRALRALE